MFNISRHIAQSSSGSCIFIVGGKQPLNASVPSVIPVGSILGIDSDVQFSNAPSPMVVKLHGQLIFLSNVQL